MSESDEKSNEKDYEGVDDMLYLPELKVSHVVDNLKRRFEKNLNFTFVGDMCVFVNPYNYKKNNKEKKIIDGDNAFQKSHQYFGSFPHEKPPHIYSIAEKAYEMVESERRSQCILVSGESGSGKSVIVKRIIEYISRRIRPRNIDFVNLVPEIFVLLESFGHAKTKLNDNSTRFCHVFEFLFDISNVELFDVTIRPFFLERSRTVFLRSGEKNFNIFYQILNDKSTTSPFSGHRDTDYYFTSSSDDDDNNDDEHHDYGSLVRTKQAMEKIGFGKDEVSEIIHILSALLFLGNVIFIEENDTTIPQDFEPIDLAAQLLGLGSDDLLNSMILTRMYIGREKVDVFHEPEQAHRTRDFLVQTIYSRLFDRVLEKISLVGRGAGLLKDDDVECCVLRVLDFPGFGTCENQGLDQMCIHYVNDKLHYEFNRRKFRSFDDDDNNMDLRPYLFDGKVGMFSLLNDTAQTTQKMEPYEADLKYLDTLKKFMNHERGLLLNHKMSTKFSILHYHNDSLFSTYDLLGFVESNRTRPPRDLLQFLQKTGNIFLRNLFPEDLSAMVYPRPSSTSHNISEYMRRFVKHCFDSKIHNVFCIRPMMSGNNDNILFFETEKVARQVRYFGIVENIFYARRPDVYCYELEFRTFYDQYRMLGSGNKKNIQVVDDDKIKDLCVSILKDLRIDEEEYKIGESKVSIKHAKTMYHLKDLRRRKIVFARDVIVRAWRRFSSSSSSSSRRKKKVVELYRDKKERRRVSLDRNFRGIYVKDGQIQELMKSYVDAEGEILFSDVGYYYLPSKKKKIHVLVSSKAIYFIQRRRRRRVSEEEEELIFHEMVVEDRIRIDMITGICMSCLGDNFMLIRNTKNYEVLVTVENKSELLSVVNECYIDFFMKDLPLEMSNSTIYQPCPDKKKKKIKVQWEVDEGNCGAEIVFTDDSLWIVSIRSNLPGSSRPKFVEKKKMKMKMMMTKKNDQPEEVGEECNEKSREREKKQKKMADLHIYHLKMTKGIKLKQQEMISKSKEGNSWTPHRRRRCLVLYDYEAQVEDELTIKVGDTILLIVKDPSGWWLGEMDGRKGLFPGNYVEEID